MLFFAVPNPDSAGAGVLRVDGALDFAALGVFLAAAGEEVGSSTDSQTTFFGRPRFLFTTVMSASAEEVDMVPSVLIGEIHGGDLYSVFVAEWHFPSFATS